MAVDIPSTNTFIDRWFHWWPWRFKTVDEIHVWWRLWSVRLGLLGTAITSALIAFPDWAIDLWATLPPEVRQYIPDQYMPFIGVAMFALSLIARFIKQHKVAEILAEKKADKVAEEKDVLKFEEAARNGTRT